MHAQRGRGGAAAVRQRQVAERREPLQVGEDGGELGQRAREVGAQRVEQARGVQRGGRAAEARDGVQRRQRCDGGVHGEVDVRAWRGPR